MLVVGSLRVSGMLERARIDNGNKHPIILLTYKMSHKEVNLLCFCNAKTCKDNFRSSSCSCDLLLAVNHSWTYSVAAYHPPCIMFHHPSLINDINKEMC